MGPRIMHKAQVPDNRGMRGILHTVCTTIANTDGFPLTADHRKPSRRNKRSERQEIPLLSEVFFTNPDSSRKKPARQQSGEVAEWSKAPDSKSDVG